MAETKNLLGLNLNVDSELMAEAAKEAIIAGVASGLEMKETLVAEFVKSMLSERVKIEDGKPSTWGNDKCCSRMEYIIRKAFSEIIREELANMLEEQKPVLRELIRKEFQKKQVQSQFVEMFMKSLTDSITNQYSTKVNVEFAEKRDRY